MTPQLHHPGPPAPPERPARLVPSATPTSSTTPTSSSNATRLRARLGAATLVAAGLAVSACAATTTQSTAAGSVTTRARGPVELAINADVAALGKVVGDLAPEQTTTTKPGDPGGGGTETTAPGETVTTPPTTAAPITQPPPVTPAPTRPPVITTQTFISNPNNNPTRPQPSPFGGSLSADEAKLLSLLQERTGPLTLDAGLMQAARDTPANGTPPVPPNTPGTFTGWVSGQAYGNSSIEGVFSDGAINNRVPTAGGHPFAGVGVRSENGNFYLTVILAKT